MGDRDREMRASVDAPPVPGDPNDARNWPVPVAPVTHAEALELLLVVSSRERWGAPDEAMRLRRYITEQEAARTRDAETVARLTAERDEGWAKSEVAHGIVAAVAHELVGPCCHPDRWAELPAMALRLREHYGWRRHLPDDDQPCPSAPMPTDSDTHAETIAGLTAAVGAAERERDEARADHHHAVSVADLLREEISRLGDRCEAIKAERDAARDALARVSTALDDLAPLDADDPADMPLDERVRLALLAAEADRIHGSVESLERRRWQTAAERDAAALAAAESSSLAAAGWPWERRRRLYLLCGEPVAVRSAANRADVIADVEWYSAHAGDGAAVMGAMADNLNVLAVTMGFEQPEEALDER